MPTPDRTLTSFTVSLNKTGRVTVSRRLLALTLLAAAVVWAIVNGPVEGPVLLTFAPGMGLTVADLLSVALFVAAVALLCGPRQRRRMGEMAASVRSRSRS
jgi:hypothetical protein